MATLTDLEMMNTSASASIQPPNDVTPVLDASATAKRKRGDDEGGNTMILGNEAQAIRSTRKRSKRGKKKSKKVAASNNTNTDQATGAGQAGDTAMADAGTPVLRKRQRKRARQAYVTRSAASVALASASNPASAGTKTTDTNPSITTDTAPASTQANQISSGAAYRIACIQLKQKMRDLSALLKIQTPRIKGEKKAVTSEPRGFSWNAKTSICGRSLNTEVYTGGEEGYRSATRAKYEMAKVAVKVLEEMLEDYKDGSELALLAGKMEHVGVEDDGDDAGSEGGETEDEGLINGFGGIGIGRESGVTVTTQDKSDGSTIV